MTQFKASASVTWLTAFAAGDWRRHVKEIMFGATLKTNVMDQIMKKLIFLLIGCFISQYSYASEEGVLPFAEFVINSKGIGESGPIIVRGVKDGNGKYKRCSIEAFGKALEVDETILKQIPSKYQNGIQLSYEAGYKTTGGRTVYIVFMEGFTSGIDSKFIVSVSEDGTSKIIENSP